MTAITCLKHYNYKYYYYYYYSTTIIIIMIIIITSDTAKSRLLGILCDFTKRCLLSFCWNTVIARVLASVAEKKKKRQEACCLAKCQLRAQA